MQAHSKADGGVVFAGATSHAPHIVAFPDRAPAGKREAFYAAARTLGERLRASRPEAVAVVSSDHFTNFGHDAMPAFALGRADEYWGPVEDWLGLPQRSVPGAGGAAERMAKVLLDAGFDLTVCNEMTLEHGMAVPLHFVDPDGEIPLVPIIQNCTVPPLPALGRCFAFGQALDAAAGAAGVRLAVVGAGGLSHAPGAETSGRIDEDFDREFLARLGRGVGSDDPGALFPPERVDAAGFGTWEIRQWFTAWGAAGGAAAEPLAYEPVPEWETGCAVAVFGARPGSG